MANSNENTAATRLINFGEAVVDGKVYDGPQAPSGFRTLSKDGYFKIEIEEAEPGESDAGNAVLNLVVRVTDTNTSEDAGARVYGTVVCSGISGGDKPQPNIFRLIDLMLSAGRSKESVDAMMTGATQISLGEVAAGLIQSGKNVAYARMRHEISKQGKMAGKEVVRANGFVTSATYEKQFADRGVSGIRWDKKLDGAAAGSGQSKSTKPNGATGGTLSTEQLDKAAANI